MKLLRLALLLSLSPLAAHAAWETPTAPTSQIAEQSKLPAPGITATVREPFYKVTTNDISEAVAEQLASQGVEAKAEVMLAPGTPTVLHSADHPVKVVIHTLQIDPNSKRWQAQANFVAGNVTESVKPIGGTYSALIDVPVLTRQFTKNDVIEEADIRIRSVPSRLLRKDTVTDKSVLLGQSPRNGISPDRPIHANEITSPMIIKKGDLVEMTYSSPFIKIKTTGVALEDAALGAAIRVKNQKSERAISARAVAAGRVEVAGTSL